MARLPVAPPRADDEPMGRGWRAAPGRFGAVLVLRTRERGRMAVFRAARITGATVAAFIAEMVGLNDPPPLVAALTAVLVVQASTLVNGVQGVLSVVAGVVLAVVLVSVVGLTWWSLGAIVAASILVGQILRLGPHLREVPISAMLVLGVGTRRRPRPGGPVAWPRRWSALEHASVAMRTLFRALHDATLERTGDEDPDYADQVRVKVAGLMAAIGAVVPAFGRLLRVELETTGTEEQHELARTLDVLRRRRADAGPLSLGDPRGQGPARRFVIATRATGRRTADALCCASRDHRTPAPTRAGMLSPCCSRPTALCCAASGPPTPRRSSGIARIPTSPRYQSWTAPAPTPEATRLVEEFAAGDPARPGWFQYAIDLDATVIGDVGLLLHTT